jgi:O-antigen ligase
VARFAIPLLTYVVAKNAVRSRREYLDAVWLLILGFMIPIFLSVYLILQGKGLEGINYWTGAPRYEGIYLGPHDMSHNAAFLLMLVWLYVLVWKADRSPAERLSVLRKVVIALLIPAGLFCLYQAHVRTTTLGVVVFVGILLVVYYKKPLPLFIGICALVLMMVSSEAVRERFFPEGAMAEKDTQFNAALYGSGRPLIWMNQIKAFAELPIDKQLAGIGIGNSLENEAMGDFLWLDSHNDFLRVVFQTGVIGFLLFAALQLAILQKILSLESSKGRYAFLALYAAVAVMNFFSNSYVARFGLAQMYYLVIAYIELPSRSIDPKHDKSSETVAVLENRATRTPTPTTR